MQALRRQGGRLAVGLVLALAGAAACRGAVGEAPAPLEERSAPGGARRARARLPTTPAGRLPSPGQGCAEQAEAVRALGERARARAVADGCASVEDCGALPMGAKPCGGPWTYLPFCARRTDVAALEATLAELLSREQDFNAACAGPSDCAMVGAPTLALVEGRCVAR